jgi:penicillin-binding protein 2
MGETPGLVPTEAYHKHVDAATGGYQKGMSINTSIGQGALMVTPLQLAMAYAAIANGHQLLRPQLALRTETADYRLSVQQKIDKEDDPSAGNGSLVAFTEGAPPKILRRFLPHVRRTLTYSAEHIKLVQDGLYAAASLPGGTSYAHRSKLVSMVGKTGTAQVVRLGKERLKVEEVDYEERDHAWFVGYAPAESPEIVVAVLNEHAGHGGSAAAPIAVGVIEAYFKAKAAISPQSTPESGK